MKKLSDLVGERIFGIVPKTDIRHPLSADASGVIFELDDFTCLVFEDPDDGYRSSAAPLLIYEGSAYQLGYDGYAFPEYLREPVVCSHRTQGRYGCEDDVLEVRSKATGKLIFEVGTEDIDDYYPGYVCRWMPEGLAANAASAIETQSAKTAGLGPKDESASDAQTPTGDNS